MTLEAQRGRRQQREYEKQSEKKQPQFSAAASSSQSTSVNPIATQAKKPIVSLSPKPAANSVVTSNVPPHLSPHPPATESVSHSSPAPSPQSASAADTRNAGEDELSSRLNQLALDKAAPQPRMTPLQALAARSRGSLVSSSSRPATDTATARRLVMGALGIRNERSEEEKEKERQARREHQRMKREQLAVQKKQAADAPAAADTNSTEAAALGDKADET